MHLCDSKALLDENFQVVQIEQPFSTLSEVRNDFHVIVIPFDVEGFGEEVGVGRELLRLWRRLCGHAPIPMIVHLCGNVTREENLIT